MLQSQTPSWEIFKPPLTPLSLQALTFNVIKFPGYFLKITLKFVPLSPYSLPPS